MCVEYACEKREGGGEECVCMLCVLCVRERSAREEDSVQDTGDDDDDVFLFVLAETKISPKLYTQGYFPPYEAV
jgi:hypothetical protein